MRLSQAQLKHLETCPRKFQHIDLEHLNPPTNPQQWQHLRWGSRFHKLMQQRELGLSIASLAAVDPQMQSSIKALEEAAPEIFSTQPPKDIFRQAEHRRSCHFQGYMLTAVYDLLIADSNSARIFDWKTYPLSQKSRSLAREWQTRLYLFIMAETSDYPPEMISMTYWFVQSGGKAQSLTCSYESAKHEETQRDLTRILKRFQGWLQAYEATGELFPQVPLSAANKCLECPFALRCQRLSVPNSDTIQGWETLTNLADIQEVCL